MRLLMSRPAALTLLLLAGRASGNLIYNGSFELDSSGFTTEYAYTPDLTASGSVVVGTDPHQHHCLAASYGDHTSGFGKMLIANGSVDGDAAVWEQTVPVRTNTQYAFFYWLSTWTADDIKLAQIRCLINGVRVGSGFATTTAGEWGLVLHRWDSGANSEASIRLVDRTGTEAANDFALDDIGMVEAGEDCVLLTSSTRGGSVASPGEGILIYPKGALVGLEAKCEPGYEFAGWGGDFGSRDHILWAEMDTDHLAVARFKKLDYAVTAKACGRAPDEFSTCSESAERLAVVSDALASGDPHGLILGQNRDLCDATYLLPIFTPPGGVREIATVVVNVYGTTRSAGAVVRIGDSGPYRPLNGCLHQEFLGEQLPALLGGESEGPVYWLPVTVDAIMGVWDLAGVYVSYDCPSVPPALLRRFHDHFSIYQALDRYARDPCIRELYSLQAIDPHIWETVVQTVALTEDLAGYNSTLGSAVDAGVDGMTRLLGRWESLLDAPDLTALATCNTTAIPECLDRAVVSGQACVTAYAAAIADGLVAPEEAGDLDEKMARWQQDLTALQSAMAESFGKLADVCRQANSTNERPLRDTAEKMLRVMTPWYVGEPDDLGFWIPSSPTYLEQAIESLPRRAEGLIDER
jgi:hypothetical protein